jgi:hypothetical protein
MKIRSAEIEVHERNGIPLICQHGSKCYGKDAFADSSLAAADSKDGFSFRIVFYRK